MPKVAASNPLAGESARTAAQPKPYPRSWIDRFTDQVERMPGPAWLFYLALGLGLFLVASAIKWYDEAYPVGHFEPFHGVFMSGVAYVLAVLHYLDRLADSALHTFREVLDADQAHYDELRYQLTTLPARPALLATLAGAGYGIYSWSTLDAAELSGLKLATSPLATAIEIVVFVGMWSAVGLFLYHTIHQLRTVNYIYTKHTRINLFALGPLYELARLTEVTAIAIIPPFYLWHATWPIPDPVIGAATFASWIIFGLTAVVTFVGPLLGVHRLLEKEKARHEAQASKQMEAAIAELHRRMSFNELAEIEKLKSGMEGLVIERAMLQQISTWPWRPETPRLLGSALLLPILLLVLEQIIRRLLGS